MFDIVHNLRFISYTWCLGVGSSPRFWWLVIIPMTYRFVITFLSF